MLVAAAQDDAVAVDRRLERFTTVAEGCPPERPDVVSGSAGLLLAAAALVEQLAPSSPGPLLATGDRLAHRLTRLAAAGLRQPPGSLGWLGAAHGWCGIAHALLRWCQATGSAPGADVAALLDLLGGLRLPDGRWPRSTGSDEVWPGWCHGSAGWAQLWTLAAEVRGDDEARLRAEDAAQDAVAIADAGPGLCCGEAGAAYAALSLYRAGGDGAWLDHARRLAHKASSAVPGADFPEHSLWQGDLGVALLLVELEEPSSAAMPLYRRN